MNYEDLERIAQGIPIIYKSDMPKGLKGCYKHGTIFLREGMPHEKTIEILAEEIGHHYTSAGDLTDYSNINAMKQEVKARRFGYELTVTLENIINAWRAGVHNLYEMAKFCGVSPESVLKAIDHYKQKYGLSKIHGEYCIVFEPLHVYEYKDLELLNV